MIPGAVKLRGPVPINELIDEVHSVQHHHF